MKKNIIFIVNLTIWVFNDPLFKKNLSQPFSLNLCLFSLSNNKKFYNNKSHEWILSSCSIKLGFGLIPLFTKVMQLIASYIDLCYFIYFRIEVFKNLPHVFQSPKNIFNNQYAIIHWTIMSFLVIIL